MTDRYVRVLQNDLLNILTLLIICLGLFAFSFGTIGSALISGIFIAMLAR
ncbi:hypothetical protein AALB39_09340 [Lachnospiraceae bacterium 54-53]